MVSITYFYLTQTSLSTAAAKLTFNWPQYSASQCGTKIFAFRAFGKSPENLKFKNANLVA